MTTENYKLQSSAPLPHKPRKFNELVDWAKAMHDRVVDWSIDVVDRLETMVLVGDFDDRLTRTGEVGWEGFGQLYYADDTDEVFIDKLHPTSGEPSWMPVDTDRGIAATNAMGEASILFSRTVGYADKPVVHVTLDDDSVTGVHFITHWISEWAIDDDMVRGCTVRVRDDNGDARQGVSVHWRVVEALDSGTGFPGEEEGAAAGGDYHSTEGDYHDTQDGYHGGD
jgi:hypothetical protein